MRLYLSPRLSIEASVCRIWFLDADGEQLFELTMDEAFRLAPLLDLLSKARFRTEGNKAQDADPYWVDSSKVVCHNSPTDNGDPDD